MRNIGLSVILLLMIFSVGCVRRSITVTSEPDGALVYLNDEEVGRTPVTVPFTFYGTYSVRLEKDGYETLNTMQKAKPPIYEYPGPDLVAEVLPIPIEAEQNWHYEMVERQPIEEERLIDFAQQMRSLLDEEVPPQSRLSR